LAQYGFSIIHSDEIARQALEPSGAAYSDVVRKFGKDILKDDGKIDRTQLGAVVFADEEARKELEGIVHPVVFETLKQFIHQGHVKGLPHVVIEIPLLFEVGWEKLFNRIWVVSSFPEIQLGRVQSRDHLTKEKAMQRIAAQLPLSYKESKADAVIYNNQDLSNLEAQVELLIKTLE
jgi:dephospho-CoA kinase